MKRHPMDAASVTLGLVFCATAAMFLAAFPDLGIAWRATSALVLIGLGLWGVLSAFARARAARPEETTSPDLADGGIDSTSSSA